MSILQGARMYSVFGPNYLFFHGERGPAYAKRLYLQDVHLATIHDAPKDMTLEAAMLFLRNAT
jgi:hypothetical protein